MRFKWGVMALLAWLSLSTAQAALMCAAPGKEGQMQTQGVVNQYWAAPAGVSLQAGQTMIPLGSLRAEEGARLEKDDLLLVIQMQGAELKDHNDERYGNGVNGRGAVSVVAGHHEMVKVASVSGQQVIIAGAGWNGGLLHNYIWRQPKQEKDQGQARWQLVRVPQYQQLDLTGDMEALPWDGSSGGVLAVDVQQTLDLNGHRMSVAGKGFRGGAALPLRGAMGSEDDFRYEAPNAAQVSTHFGHHGSKGEGVAGTSRWLLAQATRINTLPAHGRNSSDGYPFGSMAKGAPGNAGGGGQSLSLDNRELSGGGGGAGGVDGTQGRDRQGKPLGGLGGAGLSGNALLAGGGGGAAAAGGIDGADGGGGAGGGILLVQAGRIEGAGVFDARGVAGQQGLAGGGGGGGGTLSLNSFAVMDLPDLLLAGGAGGTGKAGDGGNGGLGRLLLNGSLLNVFLDTLPPALPVEVIESAHGIAPAYVCQPDGITLTGLVFADNNVDDATFAYDGHKQDNESGLAGLEYRLTHDGQALINGRTDALGRFSVHLPPLPSGSGELLLEVAVPQGWQIVAATDDARAGLHYLDAGRWQLSQLQSSRFQEVQLALVEKPRLVEPPARELQAPSTQIFLFEYLSAAWGEVTFRQQVHLNGKRDETAQLLLDPDCSGRSMFAVKHASQRIVVRPGQRYCVRTKVELGDQAGGSRLSRRLDVQTRLTTLNRQLGDVLQTSTQVNEIR